jgi:glycosyltransferase involved in cell wall biosynthesis
MQPAHDANNLADPVTTSPEHAPTASADGAASTDQRPVLAVIANAIPPYRLHAHQRIAREIPEMRLATVLTHEISNAPWALAASDEIGLVSFGQGEDSAHQAKLGRALHEWRKGGRIIDWLASQNVGAVLLNGYNDPARMRIIRWCRKRGIPVLLFGDSNIHGDRAAGLKAKVKHAVLRRVLRRVDAVLACGQLGRAYFERYGVAAGDIFYSPYEPNYGQIQSLSNAEIEAAIGRFNLQPGRRRIVFSGRLTGVKRPELLVEAFRKIAKERPDWDLLLIGDGPMRAELQAKVGDLADRITWTGFLDDQQIVSALYRNGDVLALPSDYEPWALVVNEAAAAGLAIVCSDVVGAAAELVEPGRNGERFAAGSLEGLVAALLRVTDPDRVDRYKAGSGPVLAAWREAADPVEGLRRALQHVGCRV